jgi:hypothetical protein
MEGWFASPGLVENDWESRTGLTTLYVPNCAGNIRLIARCSGSPPRLQKTISISGSHRYLSLYQNILLCPAHKTFLFQNILGNVFCHLL